MTNEEFNRKVDLLIREVGHAASRYFRRGGVQILERTKTVAVFNITAMNGRFTLMQFTIWQDKSGEVFYGKA